MRRVDAIWWDSLRGQRRLSLCGEKVRFGISLVSLFLFVLKRFFFLFVTTQPRIRKKSINNCVFFGKKSTVINDMTREGGNVGVGIIFWYLC